MNKCIYILFTLFVCMANGIMAQKSILLSEPMQREEVNVSRYADSISFVALETSDECLLSNSLQMWCTSEYIFVNDLQNRAVYQFSRADGKFLNPIGKIGQGPGEYGRIMNIYADDVTRRVYLMDAMKKTVFVYSYDGKFLYSFMTKFVSYGMARVGNTLIFSDAYYEQTHKELYVTDMKGKIKHSFDFVSKDKRPWVLENSLFFSHHGHCAYKHVLSDVIYEIYADMQKKAIYKIDCGKYNVKKNGEDDVMKNGNYTESRDSKIVVRGIRTLSHYLFITYVYENQLYTAIYDEHTGKILKPGTGTMSGFKDDLHGGPLIDVNSTECPSYHSTVSNQLISVAYCSEMTEEDCSLLTKIVGQINNDSNPVIRIVTLK